MAPYDGEPRQYFHRDRPHWEKHPLRMDYLQLMLYLTDVDENTHCFSISPESVNNPILDRDSQLERDGSVDVHGLAGPIVLFNIALLHTATVRATQRERKTVQAYYGHRFRPFLSNCSVIPPRFWRNSSDSEVRAFYGNLNDTSRAFQPAFLLAG
ncbi:MAG: phytanoyl-CoA dioxygenase family protein [Candidatus Poribacteria bacterium]|nr:phytanoyl-CoA dioxygenase family protein [Candidatus Poribacteria bacterium]